MVQSYNTVVSGIFTLPCHSALGVKNLLNSKSTSLFHKTIQNKDTFLQLYHLFVALLMFVCIDASILLSVLRT